MSIFSNIKHYLGFGPGTDPTDPIFADKETTGTQNSAVSSPTDAKQSAGPVEFDPKMQDAIFDKVVEVFNEALPTFLSQSVNPEAQRSFLRSKLDEGINLYLESLKQSAEAFCELQWQARQADMADELASIKQKADEVEQRAKDFQQKQLSADRQKRALTERVHDLESQVSRLESEREQFELENRSLMSRLKVANVHQDEIDKLNAELEAARTEASSLRENPDAVPAEMVQKIEEMTLAIDTLNDQLRIANEMNANLRGSLNEAEDKNKEQASEIAQLNELVGQFDSAVAQMEKTNELVGNLQNQVKTLKETVAQRDSEIKSLNQTIKENIERQAEREQMLRDEINELRPLTMVDKTVDFEDDDEPIRINVEELNDMVGREAAVRGAEEGNRGDSERKTFQIEDEIVNLKELNEEEQLDILAENDFSYSSQEKEEDDEVVASNKPQLESAPSHSPMKAESGEGATDDSPSDFRHKKRGRHKKKRRDSSSRDDQQRGPNQLSLF